MRFTGIARRSLVAGAIGAALVGCAEEPPAAVTARGRSAAPDPEPNPATAVAPGAAPDAAPAAEQPVADVEAVIAAHEGRAPTQWGMEFPGVVRTAADAGLPAHGAVLLTLDACGGPGGDGYDEALIAGLVEAGVPATLFLNLRWIRANPGIAAALAAQPLFSIQNHGTQHRPLSVTGASAYGIPGTTSPREAAMEVWENHLAITSLTGTAPRWFRPGTAHLDDVGLSIAEALGERIAGFAINGDGGATLSAESVAAEAGGAVGGEIVIAHMNRPGSGTAAGILAAVPMLRDRGIGFAAL